MLVGISQSAIAVIGTYKVIFVDFEALCTSTRVAIGIGFLRTITLGKAWLELEAGAASAELIVVETVIIVGAEAKLVLETCAAIPIIVPRLAKRTVVVGAAPVSIVICDGV